MSNSLMLNRRAFLVASSCAVATPFILQSHPGFSQSLETITVRLDYTPWGIHAPFHLAAAKDWFKKENIDPVIVDGNGSTATVQIVGNGQYDIGHASLGPMAIARGKGVPIKSFATLFGQNDIALIVAKTANVTSISDLKGKTIAFTAGSLEAPFVDKFLAAGNLTRTDLNLQSVDASAKVGLYVNGRVDGIFSSPTFTLPQFQAQRPADVLRFADHNLDFLGYGLFATENTIATKADLLRRFSSIIAGAWIYIFSGHENEAVQAILAARPEAKLKPDVIRGQIEELRKYVSLKGSSAPASLTVNAESWQTTLSALADADLVPTSAKSADYFNGSLLNPDLIATIGKG